MSHPYEAKYDPSFCEKLPGWATYTRDGKEYSTTITQLCAWYLKISRRAFYYWLEKYPEFAEAAAVFESISQAHEEDIANRGVQGDIPGYNPTIHIFSMKNRYRECYGELGVNVPHPAPEKSKEQVNKDIAEIENNEREY